MSQRKLEVAIDGAVPLVLDAVERALVQAGHSVVRPPDLGQWLRAEQPGRVCIATVIRSGRLSWLRELRAQRSCTPLLAIVEGQDQARCLRVLRAGADGVIPAHATAAELTWAVELAAKDQFIHDGALTRRLVASSEEPAPDEGEAELLRALGDGATVPQLAEQRGVSTRTLERRLKALCTRMGVRDRQEAILQVKLSDREQRGQ